MGITVSSKPSNSDVLMRSTALTAKTTFSASATFEQWGTEEATVAQADAPAAVDVAVWVSGSLFMQSSTSGHKLRVEISTDGGSTWSAGHEPYPRDPGAGASDRVSVSAMHQVLNATVTGDVLARAMVSADVHGASGDFHNGFLQAIVKTAET